MNKIEINLKNENIVVDNAPIAVANYLPFTSTGNEVYISGQLPFYHGDVIKGRIIDNNDKVNVELGIKAARYAAISIIKQIYTSIDGDWQKFDHIIKICGFVNAAPEFTDIPKIVNGASDLFCKIFDENGKHARSAIAVSSLPLGAIIEIEAIIKTKE